jgi:hypothetical protein
VRNRIIDAALTELNARKVNGRRPLREVDRLYVEALRRHYTAHYGRPTVWASDAYGDESPFVAFARAMFLAAGRGVLSAEALRTMLCRR